MLTIFSACKEAPRPSPPRVVDGVLNLRDWNFEEHGPLRLEGDWEAIPEGTLEGDALVRTPPQGDFLRVPWNTPHHRTRGGLDVDEPRWLQLRVRVRVPEGVGAVVLEVTDYLAEAFYAECRDVHGASFRVRAGIESPSAAAKGYREALSPWGEVALSGDGTCTFVVPRAALGRTVMASAPSLDRASLVPRRKLARSAPVLVNLAMFGTFFMFAATVAITQRRDAIARWSVAFAALWLIRIVVVNRGMLVALEGDSPLTAFPWWRIEYADLWLFGAAFLRYGEALVERHIVLRRPLFVAFFALAAVALAAPYDGSRRLVTLGQLALVAALSLVLVSLFRSPPQRSIAIARTGILVALVGALGSIASVQVFGYASRGFELFASLEPLFQMAVLAVRAQDARRKAAALARATQHFVPKEFLQALGHDDVTTTKLGDATSRRVTVLFADIRNFTAMSERMSPDQTFAFLNACLSRIGPHIRAHGGFVDKYIGDAIMALFPGSPSDAIRAALDMQAEVRASNERHPERPPLAIGIGVHVGDVMMGTIGESERFEATVISDTVNLTARLESLTKTLGSSILLSAAVQRELPEELRAQTRTLGRFVVKGKSQVVEVVECFASDPAAVCEAKEGSRDLFDEMLAAYASANLERATDLAARLRDRCPEDGPAAWWFMRTLGEFSSDDPDADGFSLPSERGIVLLDAK